MIIGVPKEIKNHEYRVGMVPASVRELVNHGHQVFVETDAGMGIGFTNEDYVAAGAEILSTAAEVFAKAEMIVKVKEPQAVERAMLREDQILFTYLHLAPDLPQTEDLVKSGAICIAYETVTDARGGLPLLAPMSEVAGMYEENLKLFGPLRLVQALSDEQIEVMSDAKLAPTADLPRVEDAVEAGGVLAGPPELIIEQLKNLEKKYPGLERISVSHPMGTPQTVLTEQLQQFAEEVIPAFKKEVKIPNLTT